ncbi:hypothetical protein K501DRAFT_284861 [Backusella circina FSU 941]|nr:hypothetical protein K501DRAFT_284861 [Backusella circina FSU 941]
MGTEDPHSLSEKAAQDLKGSTQSYTFEILIISNIFFLFQSGLLIRSDSFYQMLSV